MAELLTDDLYVNPEEAQAEVDLYDETGFVPSGPPTPLEVMRKADDVLEVSEATGTDYHEVRAEVDQNYQEGRGSLYSTERFSFTSEAYNEAVLAAMYTDPSRQQEALQTTSTILSQQEMVETLRSNPDHPAYHEMSQELVSKGYLQNSATEYAAAAIAGLGEDKTLWELAKDWLGFFVLPTYLKDQSDFVNYVLGTNKINGPDALKKIVHSYWNLTPEEKKAVFPYLREAALSVTEGNTVDATMLLVNFLDPTGEEVDIASIWGTVDWAAIGIPTVLKLGQIAATVNSVRRIANLRSKEAAARANDKLLSDATGTVAEELGVSREIAASNAHPGKWDRVQPESVEDLAGGNAEIAQAIERETARIADATRPIRSENFLEIKLLTAEERKLYAQSKANSYKELIKERYAQWGRIVDDVEPIEQTDEGFKLRVKMRDSRTGEDLTQTTVELSYTSDGILQESANLKGNAFSSFVFSPTVWLESALRSGLVAESTLINLQQHRLATILNRAQTEVWKGTSGKERKRVSAVLEAGANYVNDAGEPGKVFRWDDLDAVEVSPGQVVSLTEKEKLAYFRARELFDQNHVLLNRVQRETLTKNGFMEATLGGQSRILRPHFELEKLPYRRSGGVSAYDPTRQQVIRLNGAQVEERYRKGWVLADLHDSSHVLHEGGAWSKTWVNPTAVRPIRVNPIKYVPGYVPRIYKESPYVLIKRTTVKVDGVDTEVTEPIRLFGGREEAEKFRALKLNDEERAATYVKHRHELPEPTYRELITQEAGGLFIDDRGRHLAFGLEGGEKAKVWSAQDALDRQLGYIAARMPMNQWRISVVERWVKSAESAFPGKRAHELKEHGFNVNLAGVEDPNLRAALEASRRWIRDQLLMATWEERRFQRTMVKFADWAEGGTVLGGKVRQVALNIADKDPFGSARAVAFHALLGVLNPAQLLVQAQGFSVAMALDNLSNTATLKRMRQYLGLRAMFNAGDNPGLMRELARMTGTWEKGEFEQVIKEWRLSGLADSIHTNADLEAMKLGLPMGNGALQSVLNGNLFFYREGETFTRGYAFMVARDTYLAKHGLPKNTALTKEQIIEVVELTTQKMLNLNRANRAQWQKGALGVPFQFFQVTAKFVEDVLSPFRKGADRPFTSAQQGRILAGQIALYGSAGVAFGDYAVDGLLSWAGVGPEDLTEETKAYVKDGVVGFLTEAVFGEGMAFGKRGAYLSGAQEMIEKILKDGISLKVLTGAAGHVFGGVLDSLFLTTLPLVFDPEITLTEKEYSEIAVSWFSNLGTLSNAHKAYLWWRAQAILDGKGATVAEAGEVDNLAAIALYKGLGFSSETLENLYSAVEFNAALPEMKREAKVVLKELIRDYLNEGARNELTTEKINNMERRIKWYLWHYPEKLAEEIHRETWKEILEEDSKESRLTKETRKAWENYLNYGVSASPFGKASILQNQAIINKEAR